MYLNESTYKPFIGSINIGYNANESQEFINIGYNTNESQELHVLTVRR